MSDDLLSRLSKAIKRLGGVCIIVLPLGSNKSREKDRYSLPEAGYRTNEAYAPSLQLRAPELLYTAAEAPPQAAGGAPEGDVWAARDVLVGSLRSREQLAVCLENNFYYIPAERVPEERLPIRYVALLQTPNVFFGEAGVHWYGAVAETQLVRRKNIKEMPMRRTADGEKLYFRFTIRRWISMDRPIKPLEFSFVNEFTNLFLLNNSEYVPELLLRSMEEYRFYHALRRLISRAEGNAEDRGFALNDCSVELRNGNIQAFRGGSLCAEYPACEYRNAVYTLFRKIQKALASLQERSLPRE